MRGRDRDRDWNRWLAVTRSVCRACRHLRGGDQPVCGVDDKPIASMVENCSVFRINA
jgi:hypothetical protein